MYRGCGYVIAPAGFGKTHLIADATGRGAPRQLVLTHTHAGVNALRRKMLALGVPARAARVETIASWALRLSLAYPRTSGWATECPAGDEWAGLYRTCAALLDNAFIRRIVRASYAGLYVDEYQDCSAAQHELVLKLARDLPCRILGDPLQGIFDFADEPVAWERDICPRFECLGQLETPHRWVRAGQPQIASWLRTVRDQLIACEPVDLRRTPRGVTFKRAEPAELFLTQGNVCRYFRCNRPETVVAIHKGEKEYKGKCHALARQLAGRFSSIEEIEGKALVSFICKVEGARTNQKRLKHVIAFATGCMTAVKESVPTPTADGRKTEIRQNTRNPRVARAGNAYLEDPSSTAMGAVLNEIRESEGVNVVRADLFNRVMGVLRKHVLRPELTLKGAAEQYQREFRHKGRPVGRRKLIGTTLLVKGLEFDHAIVLDAESLPRKELYVALTRGAKSLTIVATNPVLTPGEE